MMYAAAVRFGPRTLLQSDINPRGPERRKLCCRISILMAAPYSAGTSNANQNADATADISSPRGGSDRVILASSDQRGLASSRGGQGGRTEALPG